MALNISDDLWSPFKDLKNVVWRYLNEAKEDSFQTAELESLLIKHNHNFFTLLQNEPKSAKSREKLKKGMVEGINVKGIGHQILSKELYQEAIILSDMYDINEFVALDLLCTAQIQMPYYPDLPRGLVAVLLYYDGRKALVTTLLYLVQARTGVQWSVNIKASISQFITKYTNNLQQSGLFDRIFELLKSLDLSKELEKLQQNLALGGPKHRRQVIDLFNDIRNILAEIVFTWSYQSGLPKEPTIGLINYLRDVKIEEEASGKIDDVNLFLIMALLSALDLSVLHTREDGEEAVQELPILEDPSYIAAVVNEFITKPKWMCEGLQGLSTFGLAVCVASLRVVPQNFQFQESINKEDVLIDTAIEMNVFSFVHNIILENNTLFKEQFLCRRLHNLLSDFIVYMYPKVKDLRMKADEISKTVQVYIREGLETPVNLPRYFEYLMLTIGKFYTKSTDAELVGTYWCPVELNNSQSSYSFQAPSRAVSLFKFIRLAGDMLPPTLFVSYIKMLTGLSASQQTARHCFNMLKQTGSHLSSNISWDHFFMSFAQYYSNLRQEAPPQADTVYRNRSVYHKGVSPQELEGLQSVLLLIRTVTEQDEFSRLAMCEHPGWSPLTVFLGLVSCSVPIPFKSDLLLTLAALAKSSENATQMWENLEASQILVTVPTTSSYSPRGIETELEEIESRMEEYPLTRALLTLLDTLTNFGIPRTLGAGPRKPGFDPYLSFVINSVFLKFSSRSYRIASEKWEVALACLKLFDKLLVQYDPKPTDFPTNSPQEFNSPPGYHLMLQLNNKTETFNVIMDIIDEGNRFFDLYVAFPGQDTVKECTLKCLNILQRALVLQPRFSGALAASTASLILTSIYKLLLSVNRKSGQPDHCINIAKYVTYQLYLPSHSYVAVKIMGHITSSPAAHNQLTNIMLSSEETLKLVKNGFFECLDISGDDIVTKTKQEILKLLKHCLAYNTPNLTHILIGFDIKKDISRTEFQFPGVLGFPRTCLHSLISTMDSAFKDAIDADLLESAYHLLYLLASNFKTSGPVLRFIRLNKTFYKDHLTHCYNTLKHKDVDGLRQLSWILKTLAIELKILSTTKQISYLKQLTSFLINVPNESEKRDTFSLVQQATLERKVVSSESIKLDNFMTNLTPYFIVKSPPVETPQWEFFVNHALNQILKTCQKPTVPKLIDLKKLHQILFDELKNLQGTAAIGQIQAINQEIPKVLKYALELNKRTEHHTAVIDFTDAWRQVAEVLVVYIPIEILNTTEQQSISISLLLSLLREVVKAQLLPEVARYLSGAVLLILENIKKCYFREQKLKKINAELESFKSMHYYVTSLNQIFEGLVEWIMTSDVVDGELRINLYASLVTFLQITNIEPVHEDIMVNGTFYVSRLDSSKYSMEGRDRQLKFSTDVVLSFGEKLVEVICQDCIGGQELCKILAMSSFSYLLSLSGNTSWIMHLSRRGYLKHIIQSIMESDRDLKKLLEPQPENIKPLYIYLAKMLLIARLTTTRLGAELVLEQKLLGVFSNMSVFSIHPEISKAWQVEEALEDFLPSIEQQYLQMWLPTLNICNAVLTTLGTENQSAVVQIMYFLMSHLDVVELILRSGNPDLSPMSLKELALLTSVISRTANNNLVNVLENPNIVDSNRAQLYRLQKLILALLPRFILNEDAIKRLVSHPTTEANMFQTSDRLLHVMQIISNLLCYSRNIIANHGIDHAGLGVIFYPSLSNPMISSFGAGRSLGSATDQDTSLGVVVQHLINIVTYQHQQKLTYDLLVRKLKEVSEMNSGDLKQYIDDAMELCDISMKKEKAYEVISDTLEKKRLEMEYCAFMIENALYIIWVHLDYYMLKAIPKPRSYSLVHSNLSADATLPSTTESTWKVSADVISNLKQGMVSLFNDSFSKQLLETTLDRTEMDKGFVEALLRKIKRLVQFVPVK